MTIMMMNPIDLLYRNCFPAFVHKSFETLYGKKLHPNWHIDALCHYLQLMAEGKKPKDLVVNMPPRSLKTFTISVCFPAWMLVRDPSFSIIVASYADRLTGKSGRDFRALMETDFIIRLSRGKLAVVRKASETEYETFQGGGCYSTSVGGTLTGRGADMIIIDDALKAGEAASAAALDNVNEWFPSTVISRRNRPKHALMIVSMQRLHVNDLSGKLIEAAWPAFVLPAIAVEDQDYDLGGGAVYHRRKGELLQPGWDSRQALEGIETMMATFLFSAQYQQNPLPPEGNMIKREGLKTYLEHPPCEKFRHIYVGCDPSAKAGAHNDYTAIVVVGVVGRDVYILDVVRGHWGWALIKQKLESIFALWKPTQIIIETTGLGEAVRQEFEVEGRHDILGRQPTTDKATRLSRLIARFEGGHVFLPANAPWLADFMAELLGFPGVKNDDQVDALMLLLEDLAEREYSDLQCSGIVIDAETFHRPNPFALELFTNRGY